jgi:hypothetical protein
VVSIQELQEGCLGGCDGFVGAVEVLAVYIEILPYTYLARMEKRDPCSP